MSAWQQVPSAVVPCSLVFARCGAAAVTEFNDVMSPVGIAAARNCPKPFDADITTGYGETLLRHCCHAFNYGIASHVVFAGDLEWHRGILPVTLLSLLQKFVVTAQQLQHGDNAGGGGGGSFDGIVQVSAGSFDTAASPSPRFDSNVIRFDIRPSDPLDMCRRVLGATSTTANDGRRIGFIRASIPDYVGCEVSCTFFVLPPSDTLSWEAHSYLRQTDRDLLISRNALTMFIWHTSSPPTNAAQVCSADVFMTLSKQKERLCAAIPNTPAARFLLQSIDGASGRGAEAQQQQSGVVVTQISSNTMEEMKAMEAEIASLRAACLQMNSRNQQLSKNLAELTALTAQQQSQLQTILTQHQQLQTSASPGPVAINVGGARHSAGLLLPPLPLRNGMEKDGRSPSTALMAYSPLPDARDVFAANEASRLAQQIDELHGILAVIQSSVLTDSSNDILKGCVLWRQKESDALLMCLQTVISTVGRELPPSLAAGTPFGALSVGPSIGVDPLTGLYRQRIKDIELELIRLSEFDVEGLSSQFFTNELERMEGEVVAWMTKFYAERGSVENTDPASMPTIRVHS